MASMLRELAGGEVQCVNNEMSGHMVSTGKRGSNQWGHHRKVIASGKMRASSQKRWHLRSTQIGPGSLCAGKL